MTILQWSQGRTRPTLPTPADRAPVPRTPGEVWADTRPNVLRWLVELAADRLNAAGDAERAAYGLVVERLPWGHRRVYDPRVPAILDAVRARALTSGDPVDTAVAFAALADIARTDPGTAPSVQQRPGQAPTRPDVPRLAPAASRPAEPADLADSVAAHADRMLAALARAEDADRAELAALRGLRAELAEHYPAVRS